MKKDLLILVDCIDLGALDRSLLKSCDRLAMTPSAIMTFQESALSYLTFEDFYGHKKFRSDNKSLIESVEILFSLLDRIYEPFLNYPRAFTGNIYWFLFMFAEIYYILAISRKIKESYNTVYLVSAFEYRKPFKIMIDFSPKGLMFTNMTIGVANKVSMLNERLSCQYLHIGGSQSPIVVNKHQLGHMLKRLSRRILKECATLFSRLSKKHDTIFVIQDDYEVGALKRCMGDYLFVNPTAGPLDMARKNGLNKQKINLLGAEEMDLFAREWFYGFENEIVQIFGLYQDKVLRYASSFSTLLLREFERHEPVALFYSIGAHRMYEDIAAYFANCRNIPIFYFQHGGATVYFQDIYNKNVEENANIGKICILQSSVEKELLTKGASGDTRALGSINLYKAFKRHVHFRFASKKNVLYCASPFHALSYKVIMSHVPDNALAEIHKDIVVAVNKIGLKMNIKVHPADENHAYPYFTKLIRMNGAGNIEVLKGFYAESIMKNYGILILDILATAIAPMAAVLDIPVILYQKDLSVLTGKTLSDVKKRFYLVSDKEELERCLCLFSKGKLESKYSLDFVDRYAFPIDAGDPLVNISDYVRNKINEYKTHEKRKRMQYDEARI
jgi:hypothetical protein